MFRRKSESGRSMVEMLGVLAIIGVLSIGGIAGYTLSMRKHRANQIVDALNKYALISYDSCQKAIVRGDITDINSCAEKKFIPTYAESGLQPLAGLKEVGVNISRYQSNGVYYNVFDLIPHFSDENICNATRSITGYISTYFCADEDKWYRFNVPFK